MFSNELIIDLVSEVIRLSGTSKDLQFTKEDYDEEIAKLALYIVEDMVKEGADMDDYFYDRVYETVDGHNWIIWCSYNLSVLAHSGRPHAAFEDVGVIEGIDNCQGLIQALAYWAMVFDLSDAVQERFVEFHLVED